MQLDSSNYVSLRVMIVQVARTTCFLLLMVVSAFAQPFAEPCDLLERVVVTGASVSSGYGLTTPPIKGDLGAYPVNMKHIMEGLITTEHDSVKFIGDMMFFRNPKKHGSEFITQIIQHKPTLVVGVDFLFWFGYGSTMFDVNPVLYREQKFEFGLEPDGELVLIDELFTPDSSRFWPVESYKPGASPQSFDKQYVRDYLETLDWNKLAPGPNLPQIVVKRTQAKYYEALSLLIS